jgi:hypothetical protein
LKFRCKTETKEQEPNLDFQDNLEVVTIPIKAINSRTRTRVESTLYNLNRSINTNDTALIDYTLGGSNGIILEPFSSLFCDKIIPKEVLVQNPKTVEYIAKKRARKAKDALKLNPLANKSSKTKTDQKEAQEAKDDKQKECEKTFPKPYLSEITQKINDALINLGRKTNQTFLKATKGRIEIGNDKPYGIQHIKLDLVCNSETNQELLNSGIYINDVDFTQDFKGVFNE